jgi:hypothetical protein
MSLLIFGKGFFLAADGMADGIKIVSTEDICVRGLVGRFFRDKVVCGCEATEDTKK